MVVSRQAFDLESHEIFLPTIASPDAQRPTTND